LRRGRRRGFFSSGYFSRQDRGRKPHRKATVKRKRFVLSILLLRLGSVTHAASLLGTSYQALCYMLATRYKDLLSFKLTKAGKVFRRRRRTYEKMRSRVSMIGRGAGFGILVARQIVIVGFMGTGKSSVGRELARALQRSFVDLDERITNSEGRNPKEIIEQDGEDKFRELETQALNEVLNDREVHIIAAGGGAWASARNRELIASRNGFTVWLDAPFELCWKRIETGDELRPLARSRAEAERLFNARRAAYELADVRVPISGSEDPQAIAAAIADLTFTNQD
jgi:shikimate kinase